MSFWKVLQCGIFYSDMLHFHPVTAGLAAGISAGNVCAGATTVMWM